MSRDPGDDSRDDEKITVDDPEDYNLTRRFRQIHNARDHVTDVMEDSGEKAARGEMPPGRYREVLAQAVAAYAMELEWFMREEDEDGELVESPIWDTVRIEAPRHPDGYIEGIGGFVDGFGYIDVVETLEYDSPLARAGENTSQETIDVPSVATIMRIFRQCNRFMKRVGLDVRMEKRMPEAHIGNGDSS